MLGIIIILIFIVMYFVPAFVAYKKKHKNKESIFMLNYLVGWTFIGWVFALVWALKKD